MPEFHGTTALCITPPARHMISVICFEIGRAPPHRVALFFMPLIVLETDLGNITLALLPRTSPVTCAHVARHVKEGLYDGVCFYRSDIVLQMGIHATGRKSAHAPLGVNESRAVTEAMRYVVTVDV